LGTVMRRVVALRCVHVILSTDAPSGRSKVNGPYSTFRQILHFVAVPINAAYIASSCASLSAAISSTSSMALRISSS